MGKGRKTTRGINVLIKTIKRKRQLKKATLKTFIRPEGIGSGPQILDEKPAKGKAVKQAAEATAE